MKKTSATGYFRESEYPNRRKQDLPNIELLCKSCEDRFSVYESYFAKEIFHPYVTHLPSNYHFPYNDNLSKFCASISWRGLVYLTEIKNINFGEDVELAKLNLEYFLKDGKNLGNYEQHIIPLVTCNKSILANKHSNVTSYLMRGVGMQLFPTEHGKIFYIKIPNFIILSNINYSYINKMRLNRIALRKGVLSSRSYTWTEGMYYFLDTQLRLAKSEITDKLSDEQNKKMLETVRNNLDRASKSLTMQTIEADLFSGLNILRQGKNL